MTLGSIVETAPSQAQAFLEKHRLQLQLAHRMAPLHKAAPRAAAASFRSASRALSSNSVSFRHTQI